MAQSHESKDQPTQPSGNARWLPPPMKMQTPVLTPKKPVNGKKRKNQGRPRKAVSVQPHNFKPALQEEVNFQRQSMMYRIENEHLERIKNCRWARRVLTVMVAVAVAIILLQGFNFRGFNLEENIIIWLGTATIGQLGIIFFGVCSKLNWKGRIHALPQ